MLQAEVAAINTKLQTEVAIITSSLAEHQKFFAEQQKLLQQLIAKPSVVSQPLQTTDRSTSATTSNHFPSFSY